MTLDQLIASITPDTYENLKRAVELGKWPDGSRLSAEQRANCMQAVIAYGERHLPEQDRVGFIDRGAKDEGEICDDQDHHAEKPVKFLQ